jgi:Tfp pilus assembly protein PilN
MSLFSAAEYVVVTIDKASHLRGIVLHRRHKRLEVIRTAEYSGGGTELAETLHGILKELEVGKSELLIIGSALDGGFFFRTTTPPMSVREMGSALAFDAQEQVLQLPPDFRLQFTTGAQTSDGEQNAAVYGFPAGALLPLCTALSKRRRRVDAFIYPLLALPEQVGDDKILLPELEEDFYWSGKSWHPVTDRNAEYNRGLLEFLKANVSFDPKCGSNPDALYRKFITPLLLGLFAENPAFRKQQAGLAVLPPFLRPQRYRTQLRIAALLGLALLCLGAFSALRSIVDFRSEYTMLSNQTAGLNRRKTELQSRLRRKDKEFKEMVRVNELNIGDHDMLINLARLSEAMPAQALVTSLRWSENAVDLIIQTAQQNIDMVSTLRRVPMFKINSFQNRQMSDTVMMITLKLTRVQPGKGASGGK